MTQLARIVTVTAGLLVAGGVFGAIAGAMVAGLIVATHDGPRALLDLGLLGIGATFGTPLGAVLFPLAGWLLMRHVPIGQALIGTAVGTVAAGVLGWFAPIGSDQVARTLIGGVGGFTLAVLVLRYSASRPSADAIVD